MLGDPGMTQIDSEAAAAATVQLMGVHVENDALDVIKIYLLTRT
jgi:hypothetical protein